MLQIPTDPARYSCFLCLLGRGGRCGKARPVTLNVSHGHVYYIDAGVRMTTIERSQAFTAARMVVVGAPE